MNYREYKERVEGLATEMDKPPFHATCGVDTFGNFEVSTEGLYLDADEALRLGRWLVDFYGSEELQGTQELEERQEPDGTVLPVVGNYYLTCNGDIVKIENYLDIDGTPLYPTLAISAGASSYTYREDGNAYGTGGRVVSTLVEDLGEYIYESNSPTR